MVEKSKQVSTRGISRVVWKYFSQYVVGYRKVLIWSSLGYIVLSFFVIPNLILVKYVFDEAIPNQLVGGILLSGVALIVIRLISVTSTIFLRKVSLRITTSIISRIRQDLLAVVYSFSYTQHARLDIRRHNVQMVQDTERISDLFTVLISRLGPSVVISLTLVIILFVINQLLFAIVAFFIPLIALINFYLGKKVKVKTQEYQEAFEDFSNSNMFILKYLGLLWLQSTEARESDRHNATVDNLKRKTELQGLFGSFQTQLQIFMVSILGISVLVSGGVLVASGVMTLGDFFAFYIAANQLNNQLNAISSSYSSIVSGNVSLEKLYNLFHSVEVSVKNEAVKVEAIDHIQVSNVSFDYGHNPILKGINLRLSKADVIAIVGENGSGKSTLIQVVLGLIKPLDGEVSVNDVDYRRLDLCSMRRNIGVVTQYPMLLPGTIESNITYGSELSDRANFEEAVCASLVDCFVGDLPDKYETETGEDGTYLSGGERQKVAIARALVRKPNLVILDEPTNHLDSGSVKRIMENIRQLAWNPAIVVISHDAEVVSYVDQVYEIEEHRLIKR